MKQRCQNPNSPLREWYSEKGVKVCDRWQLFENFIADMGLKPPGTYLDRINSEGDYEPGNVRWATKRESMINRSFPNATANPGIRKNGNRYNARAKLAGKEHYIGSYLTLEEAVRAREEWLNKHDNSRASTGHHMD